MVLRFYPKKDATIYELYPQRNTGLDAILDISKTIDGSSNYSSRILLDFDYTAISQSIIALGKNPNQFNYYLKLYTAEANEIPVDYTLECYSISGSWNMGIGRFGNIPQTTEGVSWYYKQSISDPASAWSTSSLNATVTASWTSVAGGGTWYTSSIATQSFSYTTSDVNMDVTNLIRKVQSGSYTFDGFIVKKTEADEQSTSTFKSLKFFSKDTHTVYLPVLEAKYNDSISTGSLSLINTNQELNIICINLKESYNEKSIPILRFSARYKYPVHVFTTSSLYLDRYRLPVSTSYAIRSAQSDDTIIDFDSTYTRISDDDTSNYIKLHLDSFQPERYYKILLKVPNSDGVTYEIYDENWIFKVTRS